MAKKENQKLKLFYLCRILEEETDEEHGLTMPEIIDRLDSYGITAERKSIYSDFELLNEAGFEIIKNKIGKNYYYSIGTRKFELVELKLLVDAIQSSRFITSKKSKELITKIESLTSKYEAGKLQRQVYVQNRIKSMNESIYLSVDAIHNAISANKQIKFQYSNWNLKKEMEKKRGGAFYQVSPWALAWDDENYYLIAFDSTVGEIRHYRVDKMMKLDLVDQKREGKELFDKFDLASYMKESFGMFHGDVENVRIELQNEMAGIFVDRFGRDINFIPVDDKHSSVSVRVSVSDAFLGWIFGLGEGVKIVSPPNVVEKVNKKIKSLERQYK